MFELFEKREKERKIRELCEVCPDITEVEANAALDMMDGREEDAAAALVSDPSFKRKVRVVCGTATHPNPNPPPSTSSRQPNTGRAANGGGATGRGDPQDPAPSSLILRPWGITYLWGPSVGKGSRGGPRE